MKAKLEEKKFVAAWDGDNMRPGDNVRSHSWTGQLVTIELSGDEDSFTIKAVEEYDECQPLETTVADVEKAIKARTDHLAWVAEWEKYYNKVQFNFWYVGTDYAPADRPEVYDDCGNYLTIVPKNINPGDFKALDKVVSEALEEM